MTLDSWHKGSILRYSALRHATLALQNSRHSSTDPTIWESILRPVWPELGIIVQWIGAAKWFNFKCTCRTKGWQNFASMVNWNCLEWFLNYMVNIIDAHIMLRRYNVYIYILFVNCMYCKFPRMDDFWFLIPIAQYSEMDIDYYTLILSAYRHRPFYISLHDGIFIYVFTLVSSLKRNFIGVRTCSCVNAYVWVFSIGSCLLKHVDFSVSVW